MKRLIGVILVVVVSLFALSTRTTCADTCDADLNKDGEVNKLDWQYFKEAYKTERGITDCDSSDSNYPAPVPETGQNTSWATGDDGYFQMGVEWPNPRFTDNEDGTVTDNLTGLIWLKDANCFGIRNWPNALSDSNGLASGQCGLTDGSSAGDWRLPNRRELFSLIHDDYYTPAVPDTAGTGQWSQDDPFNNVQSFYYWSSTTRAHGGVIAWGVYMGNGRVSDSSSKAGSNFVWPVRGGH